MNNEGSAGEERLKAPFPWFGGKSRIADEVWQRFGNVESYVEPFCGSAAILLTRPDSHRWWEQTECLNDKDGMVSNVWRAIAADPEEVARYADWPVNENDLHARHIWLVQHKAELVTRLEGDPDYYDAKIAGYWLWGIACWIGGGWCSGEGPWTSVDGQRVRLKTDEQGVKRQRVHLGGDGQGVNRKLVHLGDDAGAVCEQVHAGILDWMVRLQKRLRRVRVCSGDWKRVLTPIAMRLDTGLVGVFLDPPYSTEAGRDMNLYSEDSSDVAHEVRKWALANGEDPRLRIAICGYDREMGQLPPGWTEYRWSAQGGYGLQGDGRGKENRERETIWFSPHCLRGDETKQLGWDL